MIVLVVVEGSGTRGARESGGHPIAVGLRGGLRGA